MKNLILWKWMLKAVFLKDDYAAYCVAESFCTGDLGGTPISRDLRAASKWYSIAQAYGSRDAAYELGFMYLQGEGVETDISRGIVLFEESAKMGSPEAMRVLVDAFSLGKFSVPPDEERAGHWRDKLALHLRDSPKDLRAYETTDDRLGT